MEQQILLSHWCKLIENLSYRPLTFYASIETALRKRRVPGLEAWQIEWPEGGLLSRKRVYLRLERCRLFFDICAAPFGSGFFVSSRLTRKIFRFSLLDFILLALVCFGLIPYLLMRASDWAVKKYGANGVFYVIQASIILLVVAVLGMLFLRNLQSLGLASLETAFINLPVVGALYEATFPPFTYYRIDQALMFQEAVHCAVLEVVDEMLTLQGVKPLTELERKPIFTELVKR
jgi:hypothetical protein